MAVPDTVERDIPNNLPDPVDVEDAPLPDTYENAKRHLRRCEEVDECKDWGDKAQALASYAKQADDDELYRMARRIQGRAVRRAGELLAEFQTSERGGRPSENGNGTDTVSDDRPRSQREAAKQAGMSKRQETTARRVAEVPEEEFEEAVESDDPPSVTELSERGKATKSAAERKKPEGFKAATSFQGRLRRMVEFCKKHDPEYVFGGMQSWESDEVNEQIQTVTDWLGEFSHLQEE